MVVAAKIGSLCFEKSIRKKIGMNQIYSPSRLYSITLPNYVILESKILTDNDLTILNCASLEIFQYKLVNKVNEDSSTKAIKITKVNAIYWLSDSIIVAITQSEVSVTQSVYILDHEKHTLTKIEARTYTVGAPSLYENSMTFSCHLATIVLDNIEYIVWFGRVDVVEHRFCFHLLPKIPSAPTNAKKFYANVFHRQEIFAVLYAMIDFDDDAEFRVTFPTFTNNNKLICRLIITDENKKKMQSLFGTYIAIDLEKLIDVTGMEVPNMDLDFEQEDAYSLLQIPRPSEVGYEEFYKLHDVEIFQTEQYYLTHEHTKTSNELNLINMDTLEYKTISLPSDFSGFSPHPNGFIIQWWVEEKFIEFKKMNLCWQTDTLEDMARKELLFNDTVDLSELDLMRRIIYPYSTGRIQKLLGNNRNYYLYSIICGVLVSFVGNSVHNMLNN